MVLFSASWLHPQFEANERSIKASSTCGCTLQDSLTTNNPLRITFTMHLSVSTIFLLTLASFGAALPGHVPRPTTKSTTK
ncbi:hypothetical protein DFP72DRAFT_1175662 [Ephemerocybe angulata]|uniref:Uncharacterized protein n=1 Tax=Ephemerocybe angulata TaxID=980116 RepID=A0A8H6LWB4_9AGAR|nr:hypothetical protein DFP72DRAFT_1175662 [Tulosesus angulatus]